MSVSPGSYDRVVCDGLTELENAIDKVAAHEAPLDIERMCRLADRVEFLRLRALGFDRSLVWQAEGFLSAASAVRVRTRMTRGQAHRAIELARKVEQLPEVAAAFGAGEISRAHVEQIADGCTPERAEMIKEIERELVAYARIADPRELRGAVREMTDAFDGDGGASSDEIEHAKNTVTLSTVGGRGVLNGDLDAESTEIVATAFDAEIAALRRTDDDRPMAARRAEAVVSLCRQYLAARADGAGPRRGRTHVSVVADIGAITGITDDLLATAGAEAAHVGMLSRVTLARILCDCKLSRILTDGPSQVIDVGRATRTISTALWNALVARDRHCTEPGCTRGPAHCDAHHIVHWSKGGPTTLENLKLLCWEHHRQQHVRDATHEGRPTAEPARSIVVEGRDRRDHGDNSPVRATPLRH
jgi:hypothetical protein